MNYPKRTQYEISAPLGDMSMIRTAAIHADKNILMKTHSEDDKTEVPLRYS